MRCCRRRGGRQAAAMRCAPRGGRVRSSRRYQSPSSEAVAVVLDAIAAGGKRGMKVASIIPGLIVEGRKVGELVDYDAIACGVQVDDDGKRTPWAQQIVGVGIRADWIERLAASICSEAI